MYFCLEILGEGSFHKYLVQAGWSGRSYVFRYNQPTQSHVRAYRQLEDYLAERVDVHKAANVWPLLGNLLPEDQLEPQVFVESSARQDQQQPKEAQPKRRGRNKEV
jgi:hypothetical protein